MPSVILIVEDEGAIALDLQMRLQALGYGVCGIAGTAAQALRLAERHRPDVVLMDIRLRGAVDGIQTAREIRQQFQIPSIFLTAYTDSETIERAKTANAKGYLAKPFGDGELHGTIQMALHNHAIDVRLQEREAWLDTILRSIGDGVVATDHAGAVQLMNASAEGITGWSEGEVIGLPIESVLPLHTPEYSDPRHPLREAISREEILTLPAGSLLVSRSGDKIPVEDSAAPIRDRAGAVSGGVLVFRDATKAAEQLRRLEHARKAETLGLLAGGIAHDFNNMLMVISGFTGMLGAMAFPDEAQAALDQIAAVTTRATELTRRLLDVQGREAPAPATIDVTNFLDSRLPAFRGILPESIVVELHTEDGLDPIRIDPLHLDRILMNLVANARDAMPAGGLLRVLARAENIGARKWIAVRVEDNGIGMSPEVQSRLFEPFFTTKAERGNGLGLSQTRQIARMNGGEVRVVSAPGAGTSVQVAFPALPGAGSI